MNQNFPNGLLDALRELIQNAVDACKLRDALMLLYDNSVTPSKDRRIMIRYEEPGTTGIPAKISVIDTGIGMDRYVIENYFLKVGRSYYKSDQFLRTRARLRSHNLDFRPVSEFGIGFMSVFMLGDRVEIETAQSSPLSLDNQRRILRIDGLGRLIEVTEDQNSQLPRFFGTRVTVQIAARGRHPLAPTWPEVEAYLRQVCVNLDYPLNLEHRAPERATETQILPEGLHVPVPHHLADAAIRIAVDDRENGLSGEIVIFRALESGVAEATLASDMPVRVDDRYSVRGRAVYWHDSGILLRGGFAVGGVPGLPRYILTPDTEARIEVSKDRDHPRSLPITDLARSRLLQTNDVAAAVFKTWFGTLLGSLADCEARPIGSPEFEPGLMRRATWLQEYSAFELYRLARTSWRAWFKDSAEINASIPKWEAGQGGALLISGHGRTMHWLVFELLLPKITSLLVRAEGRFYAKPPREGWESELQGWHTFIRDGLTWPDFAEYGREIGHSLFDDYGGGRYLNIKYQGRFADFSHDEIERLIRLFGTLIYARTYGRQARVAPVDLPLLDRALHVAGDPPHQPSPTGAHAS